MLIWAYPILWQGDFCGPVWNGFVDIYIYIYICKVHYLWVEQGIVSKLAAGWLAGWLDDGLMDRYCERESGERGKYR